jgi:3-phosphoshikimate 1-carboxyvinyltransferase
MLQPPFFTTTPTTGTIVVPGSKSYTNRALIMAALTRSAVTLHHPLYSDDTETMVACLRTLGLRIDTLPDKMVVYDDIYSLSTTSSEQFARDSGTTMRFLLPILCLIPGTKIVRGSKRLNERPIRELVDALRLLGAHIDYMEKEGHAPLRIHSSPLHSNSLVTVDASLSSQFLSALLLIAPALNGLTIKLQGHLISQPYSEMTLQVMREWGVGVLLAPNGEYHIPSGQHYCKSNYIIEGDFSSAGYFFAIAALTQSTITVRNLDPNSLQADRQLLTILKTMGNEVVFSHEGITLIGKQVLPLTLDMENCPDQVQTLAVLAAFAKGMTTISGVRSLRVKETERVEALMTELEKMGIRTESTHDTLTIYGGAPHAAVIDTYGDHRMAMAFAVAATKLPGMQIRNPEVVNKTFPGFWDQLQTCMQGSG